MADKSRRGAKTPPGEKPGTGLLRTADVLRRTGITHQVLYRYVTLGLIGPSMVTKSGVRWFRPEVVDLIGIIRSFNQRGYSLRDLKDTFFRDKNVQRLLGKQ